MPRKRSKFNMSHFRNHTFKMGQLYPAYLQEVLPGDIVQLASSIFMRFAPMVAPVMHPCYMFMHYFYVPSRVIANFLSTPSIKNKDGSTFTNKFFFDFESFITGGSDGNDVQTIPLVMVHSQDSSMLADAFGLPVQMLKNQTDFFEVNALPFGAYYQIWNEFYRDQDLQGEYYFYNSNGSDKVVLYSTLTSQGLGYFPLLQPCWSKDYFTTARPWPQKGPQVTVPVQAAGGGITGNVNITFSETGPTFKFNGMSGSNLYALDIDSETGRLVTAPISGDPGVPAKDISWDDPGLTASFESTTPGGIGSIDINDLREAFAIQRFEEKRARLGSRYEDLLRSLGVRPQDSRLQMPEYLGGFTSPVQFSEVLQTSAGEYGGVGDLYGHGIAAARGRRIRRFIPEHGYIMGIMCVRPIPVYAQGIERMWSKKTKYDFWTPELQHIGQQEVLNSEVYADGTDADGNTFGFQNRYDEYRRGVSLVTGEFRTTQDMWNLARIFDNRPALNADFVECNPSDRIFQVGEQNSDQLYCMVKNNVVMRRLVDKNGNPI